MDPEEDVDVEVTILMARHGDTEVRAEVSSRVECTVYSAGAVVEVAQASDPEQFHEVSRL